MGRTAKSVEGVYSDRPIDIDLLMYDDTVMQTPELTLPHPLMGERSFVMDPLAEIAGEVVHPVSGLTMEEMRKRLAQFI
jgi:2-amino-4-hydroxy-6-hydroxymethyldihydropteridine diphosphokinase